MLRPRSLLIIIALCAGCGVSEAPAQVSDGSVPPSRMKSHSVPPVLAELPLPSGCSILDGGLLQLPHGIAMAGMLHTDCESPSPMPVTHPVVAMQDGWLDPPEELEASRSVAGVFPVKLSAGWGIIWGEAVPPDPARVDVRGEWPPWLVTKVWISERAGSSWAPARLIVDETATNWFHWRSFGVAEDGVTVVLVEASPNAPLTPEVVLAGRVNAPLEATPLPVGASYSPSLAVDAQGDLWAAWIQGAEGSRTVAIARFAGPEAGFDEPIELFPLREEPMGDPALVHHIAHDGTMHFLIHGSAGGPLVQVTGHVGSSAWQARPVGTDEGMTDGLFMFDGPAQDLHLLRASVRPLAPDHTFGSISIQSWNGRWSSPERISGESSDQYMVHSHPGDRNPLVGWTVHSIVDSDRVRSRFVIRGHR